MRLKSLALIAGAVTLAGAAAQAAPQVERSGITFHVAVCAHGNPNGTARCHAHIVTDRAGNPLVNQNRGGGGTPSGYGPNDLRSAYKITTSGSSSTIIAIVDAYGYSNAESNLATYRTQYGLPACHSNPTTPSAGCFMKVNQNGQFSNYPSNNTGWDQEQALDIAMVSAICPNCRILLVEASSANFNDLATAENRAAAMGAYAISNSYGGNEWSGAASVDSAFEHPGVAITVSTGDSGYSAGPQYPATSPGVTAVGGTSLTRASNLRGWSESAWSGAGSGCSTVFAKPAWQHDPLCVTNGSTGLGGRMDADVSAVADPNTGVAVFAPVFGPWSGWVTFGGTSVSSPIIAALYGLHGGPVVAGGPYSNTGSLFDVTSGNNGSCGGTYFCTASSPSTPNGNGGTTYDGPTGLGTPNGTGAF
jgi:subtilase family serine protease